MKISKYKKLLASLLLLTYAGGAQELEIEYHGAGWFQFGRVEESFTPPSDQNDYNKNWMQNAGGVLKSTVSVDDVWEGALGLGAVQVHLARGSRTQASLWYPFWVSFVDEARLSYKTSFTGDDKVNFSLGLFPYVYNKDVKNLGMYLMHGYVYPGALVSPFTGPLGPVSPLFGAKTSYRRGRVSNDFIVNLETVDKPLFDISIADYISYEPHPGFEVGAGINFYRLVPQNPDVTSPSKECNQGTDLGPYAIMGQENACFIIDTIRTPGIDQTTGLPDTAVSLDTITGSLAGQKFIVRFRLDPLAFTGSRGMLGKDDLVLYGEAGILGFRNYSDVYENIRERMPVMLGLNLPGFQYVNWSLEIEYYASKNSGDNLAASNGSFVPAVMDEYNTARDNWKWSLHLSKMVAGHALFALQFANDNLRLGGHHNLATGKQALTTPKDWYWTFKMAYFF